MGESITQVWRFFRIASESGRERGNASSFSLLLRGVDLVKARHKRDEWERRDLSKKWSDPSEKASI